MPPARIQHSIPFAKAAHGVVIEHPPAGREQITLICLHGFTGSSHDFEPLLESFSSISTLAVRWLLVDLPGHGSSDAPSDPQAYAFSRLIDYLSLVIELANRDRPCLLLAYSMGGRIALHLLLHHPHLQACLIGASPGLADPQQRQDRIRADAQWIALLEQQGVGAFCEAWEAQPLIAPQTNLPEPLNTALALRRRANRAHGLAHALHHWGTGALPSLWDRLQDMPQLHLCHGARDSKFAAIAVAMKQLNPSFIIHPIPNSGHCPLMEAPAATAATVGALIGDTP